MSTPASVIVQRRIEWSDTDASGHWHNTAGFRLIEVAETTLLERLGILEDVYGRLPRVSITAEFKLPLSLRDLVDCSISVREVGDASLTYSFEMHRTQDLAMSATVVVVLLDTERIKTAWPEDYKRLLLTAGPQRPELLSVS